MKKIIILPFILLFICCQPQAERQCKDFKNGAFRSETVLGGKKIQSTFVRNDSVAIETYQGKTDTFAVHWVSDCEYVMRNSHPKNAAEKKAVAIKILTTSEKTYTFKFGNVGDSKTQLGTATRIN